MSIQTIVIFLGLLIFFSHAFNELFSLTKIPNVLLLLLIGIIIGPIGGLVTQEFFGEMGSVFTTLTLIIILFESGAGLRFGELKKAIGPASLITVANFLFTVGITVLLVPLFTDIDKINAIFLGAIVGGTSSAVVIPMVRQLNLNEKNAAILFLESALSDVLCLVVGLALFEGIKVGAVDMMAVAHAMWKSFLFAALIGLAGGFFWSLVIKKIRGVQNSMFTTMAFVFILYGIVEHMGLNGGIAALIYGILLGNSDSIGKSNTYQRFFRLSTDGINSDERKFFSEIVFLLQTYFFVYVGISLQFGSLGSYLIGGLIVLLIIAVRPLGIKLFSGKQEKTGDVAIMSVLTPKGLVPAVLASMPFQLGLPMGELILDLGYAIVLFSIVICSVLVIILSKNPMFFKKLVSRKPSPSPEKNNLNSVNEAIGPDTE
jgi:potassium/hydrogen antiporter